MKDEFWKTAFRRLVRCGFKRDGATMVRKVNDYYFVACIYDDCVRLATTDLFGVELYRTTITEETLDTYLHI